MSTHNYTLNVVKQYERKGKIKIGLRALRGIEKKEKGFLSIPAEHWDLDTMSVKPKFTELYFDTIQELNEIKARIPAYIIKLNKGQVSPEEALIACIGRENRIEGEVLAFAKQMTPKKYVKWDLTEAKIIQIIKRINALENNALKATKYVPLTFDKLQNTSIVKSIGDTLYNSNLKQDSITKYLKAVDDVCFVKKNKWRPFHKAEYLVYKKHKGQQKALSFMEIESALNKVNTLQDLEAYLFWLYSFSLLGLNFRDIINIDEDKVMQFEDHAKHDTQTYKPYHPEMKEYNTPLHIFIYRGKLSEEDKKSAPIVRLINLFPVFKINQMLRHIVKITRPEFAYTGRDKLRIFNFYTKDKDYNPIQSGVDKSELIRGTYYKKWTEMLGVSITKTRAASMKAGRLAGANFDELEAQLGHVIGVSKSFPTYYSAEQKRVDTNHIFSLMKYDIVKLLTYTINKFKDHTTGDKYWIDRKIVKEISDDYFAGGFDFPLSLLSAEEYNEMQDLYQEQEGSSYQDPETLLVKYRKANPDKFPARLKELIAKQNKLQYEHLVGPEDSDFEVTGSIDI